MATLAQCYKEYVLLADISDNTRRAYDRVWRTRLAVLADRDVDSLRYADYRAIKGGASVLRQALSLARNLHLHALRMEYTDRANPAALVEMPAIPVRYRPVGLDTGRALIAACRGWERPAFGMYIMTLALTGARRNEVERIVVAEIAADGTFHIAKTKNGKPSFIVLPAEIRAWLLAQTDPAPFARFAGEGSRGQWLKMATAIGEPDLHMHDLRRLFAAAATMEMDARTASVLLNHQSKITDDTYSQQTREARIAASLRVSRAIQS